MAQLPEKTGKLPEDHDNGKAPETTKASKTEGSAVFDKPSDFNLADLRLDQSSEEMTRSEAILINVPVDAPDKQRWIRVHPGKNFRWDNVAILTLKDDREHYLLHPHVAQSIEEDEWRRMTLFTVINRQGQISLWPVPMPPPEGKDNMWHKTARECAEHAMSKWIRVKRVKAIGYVPWHKPGLIIPEPDWSTIPEMGQLIDIAFKDGRFVKDLSHPVLVDLLG